MNLAFGALAVLGLGILGFIALRDLGYKVGFKDGHREGFADASETSGKWLLDAERGVDLARQKIWREEEPKEGRWM